jgi:hypothetical protein
MRATAKPVTVPAFGVIKGGRLNAWRFHFMHFRVDGAELEIVARCTPPAWPFFREIGLDHTHFGTLRPVIGERATRLQADPLIATAYRAAGSEPPAWIINSTMTLRARIKRTRGARRTRVQ